MSKDYSTRIARAIELYFDDQDWKYEPINDRGVIRTGTAIDGKLKNVRIYINVNDDGFTINSVLNVSADEDTMADVAEFITRANYGLRHGNFEMDYSDGEIRYKTSCYCGDDVAPSDDVIQFLLFTNIMMVQRYGNALLSVLFGMNNPEDAVKEAEED